MRGSLVDSLIFLICKENDHQSGHKTREQTDYLFFEYLNRNHQLYFRVIYNNVNYFSINPTKELTKKILPQKTNINGQPP